MFYDANKISYGTKKIKNDKLLAKNVFSETIVRKGPFRPLGLK